MMLEIKALNTFLFFISSNFHNSLHKLDFDIDFFSKYSILIIDGIYQLADLK